MGFFHDDDEEDTTLTAVISLVAGIGMTVAVPFLAYFTIKNLIAARASDSWPQAQGEITRFEITTEYAKRGVSYVPSLSYRFSANGQAFSGSRLAFSGRSSSFRSEIEEIGVKYAVGTQHAVYYDPADPSQSVLERGTHFGLYAVVFAPLLFVILGPILIKEKYQVLRSLWSQQKPAKAKTRSGKRPRRRRPPPTVSDE